MTWQKANKLKTLCAGSALCLLVVFVVIGIPLTLENGKTVFSGTGVWNGFHEHLNIVECSNLRQSTAVLHLRVSDYNANTLGERVIEIPFLGTSHVILNEFEGISDNYGIYDISSVERVDASFDVHCRTMIYRQSAGEVRYAFSVPVSDPLQGISSGVFNAINPELNNSAPVQNWLSIYNPSAREFNAELEIYDEHGNEFEIRALPTLSPKERIDIVLGENADNPSGLYRIVPEDLNQAYGANLSRYSKTRSGDFNFGLSIEPGQGIGDTGRVFASTLGPTINWAEIANTSGDPLSVELSVYSDANKILFSETREIAAHSQFHLLLNSHLGENSTGSFRARVLSPEKEGLSVSSVFYGYRGDGPEHVAWAYASKAKDAKESLSMLEGDRISLPINTFEKAANWLQLFHSQNAPVQTEIAIYDANGEEISTKLSNYTTKGFSRIAIHDEVGPDFVGQLVVSVLDEAELGAEMLRAYPERIRILGDGALEPDSYASFVLSTPGLVHRVYAPEVSSESSEDSSVAEPPVLEPESSSSSIIKPAIPSGEASSSSLLSSVSSSSSSSEPGCGCGTLDIGCYSPIPSQCAGETVCAKVHPHCKLYMSSKACEMFEVTSALGADSEGMSSADCNSFLPAVGERASGEHYLRIRDCCTVKRELARTEGEGSCRSVQVDNSPWCENLSSDLAHRACLGMAISNYCFIHPDDMSTCVAFCMDYVRALLVERFESCLCRTSGEETIDEDSCEDCVEECEDTDNISSVLPNECLRISQFGESDSTMMTPLGPGFVSAICSSLKATDPTGACADR